MSKLTRFRLVVDGAVAHLKMARGDQHNAMTAAFWSELPRAIDQIEGQSTVRVVVLSAEGPTFSSGMDLSVFQRAENTATGSAVERERLRRLILQLQSAFNRIERCRVPVIAAIQGPCIGAGFDLACACDLRYCTRSAYFTIEEINLGMMADLGTLQRLPRLIPEAAARELALTGDKLSPEKAQCLGLVADVLDDSNKLLSRATSIAVKIAERSPLAIAATRESLRAARKHSTEDALEMAATLQAAIFNPPDVIASVLARKNRDKHHYPDLLAGKITL